MRKSSKSLNIKWKNLDNMFKYQIYIYVVSEKSNQFKLNDICRDLNINKYEIHILCLIIYSFIDQKITEVSVYGK